MRNVLITVRDVTKLAFGLGLLGVVCLGWAPCAWVLWQLRRGHADAHDAGDGRDGRVGRRVIGGCIRFYLRALEAVDAMRFDISALDALEGGEPVIIAPNHPRLLDAFLVVSRLSNVVCIMKDDINDNVFLGAAARLAGYIGNASTVQMIRESVRTLRRGNHLLLFPEGTRTVREPINPLTAAVGLIASRAKVPVQTVFIECDSPYMRKGWSLFRRPSLPITFRVRLGRRFDAPVDVRAFTTELEAYFVDELTAHTHSSATHSPAMHPSANHLSPIGTPTLSHAQPAMSRPSRMREPMPVAAANPATSANPSAAAIETRPT